MKKTILLFAIMTAFTSNAKSQTATSWKISEGYSIHFDYGKVKGVFNKFYGTILFDKNNLANSKFDVKIDIVSFNAGNGTLNFHAKGKDWLNYKKYPNITFTSTKIENQSGSYTAIGVMELHGVKKEISIPFTFSENTFKGSFKILLKDYNLKGMGELKEDNLIITLSVPVKTN